MVLHKAAAASRRRQMVLWTAVVAAAAVRRHWWCTCQCLSRCHSSPTTTCRLTAPGAWMIPSQALTGSSRGAKTRPIRCGCPTTETPWMRGDDGASADAVLRCSKWVGRCARLVSGLGVARAGRLRWCAGGFVLSGRPSCCVRRFCCTCNEHNADVSKVFCSQPVCLITNMATASNTV